MRGKFWVNARAAEKKQTLDARFVGGGNEVILDLQILQEKFDGEVVVSLDAADFGRCDDDRFGLRFPVKTSHRIGIRQIDFTAAPGNNIAIASGGEFAHYSAADQPAMTRYKDRFKHARTLWCIGVLGTSIFQAQTETLDSAQKEKIHELVTWLLKNDNSLQGLPFADVIAATSGRKIIPIDREKDALILQQIGSAMDVVLTRMNAENSPVKKAGRINEASHFFEDAMQEEFNKMPGYKCSFPLTTDGKTQRSGYPDLQLDLPDGRTFYLDPKLFAQGSRSSSFRTFYFEPRSATNKVNRDACHLIVGIEHDFAATGRFLRWELVDISHFKVQLKAEFQGSNRDLYREESVVGKGEAK